MIRDAICARLEAMGLLRGENVGIGCLVLCKGRGDSRNYFEVWVFSDELRVWDGRSMMVVAKIPFSDPDLFAKVEGFLK